MTVKIQMGLVNILLFYSLLCRQRKLYSYLSNIPEADRKKCKMWFLPLEKFTAKMRLYLHPPTSPGLLSNYQLSLVP